MKSEWEKSIYRMLTEHIYRRDYRGRSGVKGNWDNLLQDILADGAEAGSPFDSESLDDVEKLRRWAVGVPNAKTGVITYPTPKQPLYNQILRYVRNSETPTLAACVDHSEDESGAMVTLAELDTNGFGESKYFGRVLRGQYWGVCEAPGMVTQKILLVQYLPGESLGRARLIEARYYAFDDENGESLEERVDAFDYCAYAITDGFWATGANQGVIFDLRDGDNKMGSMSISDFSFNTKGSLIESFRASSSETSIGHVAFTHTQSRKSIDVAQALLQRISDDLMRQLGDG